MSVEDDTDELIVLSKMIITANLLLQQVCSSSFPYHLSVTDGAIHV